jgi:hypothetical protein
VFVAVALCVTLLTLHAIAAVWLSGVVTGPLRLCIVSGVLALVFMVNESFVGYACDIHLKHECFGPSCISLQTPRFLSSFTNLMPANIITTRKARLLSRKARVCACLVT